MGKQTGETILPYVTKNGEELFILHHGLKEADEVFLTERHHNRTWTWIYRLLGWFPIFVGLFCFGNLLQLTLDKFPDVRNVVSLGTTSLPFSVSISITLSVIGISWSWYRPLVGLSLLAMGSLPFLAGYSLAAGRHDHSN